MMENINTNIIVMYIYCISNITAVHAMSSKVSKKKIIPSLP